jgi:PAS domain S-box-containing protein
MRADLSPLVADLPWPVAALDQAGTVLAVNRMWADMRLPGLDARRAMPGANFLDLCVTTEGRDAEGVREVAASLRHLLAGQTRELRSHHCPCHAGDPSPIFRLRAVAISDHARVRALVVHEEIPTSERELRENLHRCRLLADVVRAWGYVARVSPNQTYEIIWATDTSNQGFSGYSTDEVAARGGWISTVLPEDREAAAGLMQRVVAGRSDERILRKRHKDGSLRWVRCCAHPIWSTTEQRVVEIVGAVQDVTEWRQAEQDLQLHADIFRHMQLGLVVWRRDDGTGGEFRLVTANPAATRLAGIDFDMQVGGRVDDVVPATTTAQARLAISDRLVTPGVAVDMSLPVGQSDRIFSVESFALPERCVGVTLDDVTERRGIESRLRQAEKMETVGRLAGGLAHDFNNVLTTIMASASVLAEELMPGDPRRDAVRDILDAAERGASMTHRLLTFSRRQPTRPRALDLDESIAGMQNLLRRLLGAGVMLHVDLSGELATVMADPTEIEQVLLNLAVNARQAMSDRGSLTITTRVVQRPPAHSPNGLRLAWVELRVADTGVGMDDATRARVFEPFFTTKGDGTGMGLATVYGIVNARGGELDVESTLNVGTTFVVRLPIIEPEPTDTAAPLCASDQLM